MTFHVPPVALLASCCHPSLPCCRTVVLDNGLRRLALRPPGRRPIPGRSTWHPSCDPTPRDPSHGSRPEPRVGIDAREGGGSPDDLKTVHVWNRCRSSSVSGSGRRRCETSFQPIFAFDQ